MRNPIARFVVLLLLCIQPTEARACYAVIVGRAASADGSVLVGHNEENGGQRVLFFHKVPRQTHPADAVVHLRRGGQLAEQAETAGFLWSENPGLEFSDGYLNEYGVAIVSDACATREEGYDALVARGEIRDGGIGYMLRRLVALRAKSARAGVELIGQLVERFGYADSGRTYVVADPREAWLVAVVRGRRWAAQRVPDDKVVILPNVHVIGEVNLDDRDQFLASGDLLSYAQQRGWFAPSGGRAFNFRNVYQTAARQGPDPRQFRGQQIVTGQRQDWPPPGPLLFAVTPRKKLDVADVAAVLRDNAGLVPLFQKSTQEAAVFQLRANTPPEIGCIYWRTTGRPDVSVLTPWYAGIQDTPELCRPSIDVSTRLSLTHHFSPPPGTFDRDPRLAWWKFKALEGYVDQDEAGRLGPVRAAWSAFEAREFRQQAAIEAEVLQLLPSDPDAARSRLTRYCAELAEESCRQADRFAGDSQAKEENFRRKQEK